MVPISALDFSFLLRSMTSCSISAASVVDHAGGSSRWGRTDPDLPLRLACILAIVLLRYRFVPRRAAMRRTLRNPRAPEGRTAGAARRTYRCFVHTSATVPVYIISRAVLN